MCFKRFLILDRDEIYSYCHWSEQFFAASVYMLVGLVATIFLYADATSVGEPSTRQATIGTTPAIVMLSQATTILNLKII